MAESKVNLGETVDFIAEGSDIDGNLMEVRYFINGPNYPGWNYIGNKVVTGSSGSATYNWTPPTTGNWAVHVQVLDLSGLWDSNYLTDSFSVLAQTAPSVSNLGTQNIFINGSQSFSATGSDPNGDLDRMLFQVKSDNNSNYYSWVTVSNETFPWAVSKSINVSSWSPPSSPSPHGTWRLKVTGYDEEGHYSSTVKTFTITNRKPDGSTLFRIGSGSWTSGQITANMGDQVSIRYTATDPDGDLNRLYWRQRDPSGSYISNGDQAVSGSSASKDVTFTVNKLGNYDIWAHATDTSAGPWNGNGSAQGWFTWYPHDIKVRNDEPTLNSIGNVSVNANSGNRTVNLAGISSGGGDQQTISVSATSSNTGLIPNPSVSYSSPNSTGSITFKPVANKSGSAQVTVNVTDNGGTANGGDNSISRTFTVTVNKLNQTITFPSLPGESNGEIEFKNGSIVLSATSNSALPVSYSVQGPASRSGSNLTLTGVGQITITATQAGNDAYNPAASVSRTIQVVKGQQSITFNPATPISYTSSPISLSANSSSGLAVSYNLDSGNGILSANQLTLNAAGSFQVTVSQAGNANWHAATSRTRVIQVNKLNQVVALNNIANRNYSSTPFAVSASSNVFGTNGVLYSISSGAQFAEIVNGNQVRMLGGGTVTVTASHGGDGRYNGDNDSKTFTIHKLNQTIDLTLPDPANVHHTPIQLPDKSQQLQDISYSVTSGTGQILNGNELHLTGAGENVVLRANVPATAIYNSKVEDFVMGTQKLTQTISFPVVANQSYDPNGLPLNISINSPLSVSCDVSGPATLVGDSVHFTGEGTVSITATQSGNGFYHAASPVTREFSVSYGDYDGDGMPDTYEMSHLGLHLDVDDAQGDLDNDGLVNLLEYQTGADPLTPNSDGDLLDDGEDYRNGRDPTIADDELGLVLAEVGSISVTQPNSTTWHSVTTNHTFLDPVVILKPVSYNDPDPVHTRVKNVTANGFQFKLEEWDYQDGIRTTAETVHYLVAERGSFLLENLNLWIAELVDADHTQRQISLPRSFANKPIVLTGIQTSNEVTPAESRVTHINQSSFRVFLEEEEAKDGIHSLESVGYLAILGGTGTNLNNPFEVHSLYNEVGSNWRSFNFSQSFSTAPNIFLQTTSVLEDDTVGIRYRNLSAAGFDLFLEEETSSDPETGHIQEKVSLLAIQDQGVFRGYQDTDSDGLPDWWEIQKYSNLTTVEDVNGDYDLNGFTNGEEYFDSDKDGMFDAWETYYGLNPNWAGDALLDADGDGMNNIDEFLSGRDPSDSADGIQLPPGIDLVLENPDGQYFGIEFLNWSISSVSPPN